jgi:WD40 repeat protein
MSVRHGLLLLLISLTLTATQPARGELPADADKPKPPQPAKPPRTDLYGDPLPEGALARFGTIYLKANFNAIAFRADGREFYSWHPGGMLRVHDAARGKVLRVFLLPHPGHTGGRFSADGRFITLGIQSAPAHTTAGALTVWETTTGKLLHRIDAAAGESFSIWNGSLHDGRTLITRAANLGAVHVWDLKSGTSRMLRKSSAGVVGFTPSPDGKRLFVQMQESIQCWNMADGKKLWEALGRSLELALAPDGQSLLVSPATEDDVATQLLDPVTGKKQPTLRPPPKLLARARWGADGRTLLLPDRADGAVHIWDLVEGKERGRFFSGRGVVAMSPDGKSLLTADSELQRWDLRTGKPLYPSTADRGHTRFVTHLACSPDGKLLASADYKGSLRLWDLHTSRPLCVFPDTHCDYLAFTPDGSRLIAVTSDDILVTFDPTTGKILSRRNPNLENFPEELLARGGITYCDGKKLIRSAHRYTLSARAWSSGPGSVTAAWDLKTGKRLWLQSVKGTEGISGISSDGRFGVDWDLRLRELETGRLLGRLADKDAQGPAASHATVFSPDGALIATDSCRLPDRDRLFDWKDRGIEVWERTTCRLLRRLPAVGAVHSLVFAPDGRRLAVLRGTELWVHDVARGKELLRLPGLPNMARRPPRLTFVPNGRALFMPANDGSILLFAVPPVAPVAPAVLTDALLRKAWDALADPDPTKAFLAIADLADRPAQAVPLLKDRLRPAAPAPAEQLRRLITALDDENFTSREAAQRKLAALGPRGWPALRKALAARPSLEARRRLEQLLQAEKRPPSSDVLRGHRSLRVLEWAGTAPARDLLGKLASGDPDDSLTQEAKAALGRLQRMRRPD